jgi:hypothetical protein
MKLEDTLVGRAGIVAAVAAAVVAAVVDATFIMNK